MPDSSNTSRERDQSRICVDNVEDWNKVKQNFTEAMMTMLDAKVGPADKDVLVAHLMQWKDRTFDLARPNVRVNGMNMEEYDEEEEDSDIEPYDEVLDRRLWTQMEENLTWQHTLATRRRREPIHAQQLVEDLVLRERKLEAESSPPMLDINSEAKNTEVSLPPRLDEVHEMHREAMNMLGTWHETAPKLLEKVNQVEAAAAVDSRLTP